MALPANFPAPPQRPPSAEPFGSPAWLRYFDALDRWNAAVRAHLDSL